MDDQSRPAHVLGGLPAAASAFVAVLESNRQRIARDAGLTSTELRALFYVARVKSTTPKNLATHLGVTTGAVTAISRRLVEAQLLHRVDHPEDRRSLYLELTPEGHATMLQMHGGFSDMLQDATSALSSAELDIFTSALQTVSNQVKNRSETPQTLHGFR
jgi:DNA-binding MarR family transcriptional regulator